MKNNIFKILTALTLAAAVCAFAACSSDNNTTDGKVDDDLSSNKVIVDGNTSGENFKSPLNNNASKDKHIEPDLSKVKPRAASTSVADTSTEEKFLEALENFANPNGNKYDAMAVLGNYNFTEDEEALYARFADASKSWHDLVESMVGEKCIVDIAMKSKGDTATTADKFAEWQRVHGGIGEDYTNVKCVITSNYSTSSVTYNIDIVKIDGKWHLANADVMDKLQIILIDDLFR